MIIWSFRRHRLVSKNKRLCEHCDISDMCIRRKMWSQIQQYQLHLSSTNTSSIISYCFNVTLTLHTKSTDTATVILSKFQRVHLSQRAISRSTVPLSSSQAHQTSFCRLPHLSQPLSSRTFTLAHFFVSFIFRFPLFCFAIYLLFRPFSGPRCFCVF